MLKLFQGKVAMVRTQAQPERQMEAITMKLSNIKHQFVCGLLVFGVREASDKVSPPARTTSYPALGCRQVTGDATGLLVALRFGP